MKNRVLSPYHTWKNKWSLVTVWKIRLLFPYVVSYEFMYLRIKNIPQTKSLPSYNLISLFFTFPQTFCSWWSLSVTALCLYSDVTLGRKSHNSNIYILSFSFLLEDIEALKLIYLNLIISKLMIFWEKYYF